MTGLLFAGRLGEVEFDFVDVAPAPRFAGLERTHDRVLGAVEVFGGVFVLGGIAAANVSAFEAETKVDPGVTHFQALFATVGVGIDLVDVREVCAGRHDGSPSSWRDDSIEGSGPLHRATSASLQASKIRRLSACACLR
jgi:hypothetical protein